MLFANSICAIVHECVHSFSGSANKNMGEAFLVVWKIPSDSPDVPHIHQALPPEHLFPMQQFNFFDDEIAKLNPASRKWVASIPDNAL